MDAQNFGESSNTTGIIVGTDQGSQAPLENQPVYVDKLPVDAVLVDEWPVVNGTATGVDAVDAPLIHETQKTEITPYKLSMETAIAHQAPITTQVASSGHLLNQAESESLRTRWSEIQGKFVDEPRSAVQQADALVADVIEKITQTFTSERNTLENQWKEGNEVTTEDLRQTLQHYRSFFNRLID
jgi:hypothetical protein